jgi:hypothetical protein
VIGLRINTYCLLCVGSSYLKYFFPRNLFFEEAKDKKIYLGQPYWPKCIVCVFVCLLSVTFCSIPLVPPHVGAGGGGRDGIHLQTSVQRR